MSAFVSMCERVGVSSRILNNLDPFPRIHLFFEMRLSTPPSNNAHTAASPGAGTASRVERAATTHTAQAPGGEYL